MSLFETVVDYANDVYRNIPSIRPSQTLFDDLSKDPQDWEAANTIEAATHNPVENNQLIQRGFEYSENAFIDYPFEHLTASRFSDGQFPCWYASEGLETSIHETVYHFVKGVQDSKDAFVGETTIKTDRRVALISCIGLAIDLSAKTEEFPWLIDKVNYSRCQEVGKRIAKEGHPLIRVLSARHAGGINLTAFREHVLSNVREHCYLSYTLDLPKEKVSVFNGKRCFMVIEP